MEVTVTFVALPTQQAKYVVVPQLKVLTFLNRLVCSIHHTIFIDVDYSQAPPAPRRALPSKMEGPLKCRRLYVSTDGEEEARGKMVRMQINR